MEQTNILFVESSLHFLAGAVFVQFVFDVPFRVILQISVITTARQGMEPQNLSLLLKQ